MQNATDDFDTCMQSFLSQEAEEEKEIAKMSSNPESDENASQLKNREQIIDKLHKRLYNKNERQRNSDATVKGTIQVVQTKQGTTRQCYQCEVCGESLSSRRMLYDHLERHRSGYLQCGKCSMKLKSKIRMQAHQEYHAHGAWICDVCEKKGVKKEFIWKTSYLNHMRAHNQSGCFKCKICDRTLTTKQDYIDNVKFKHSDARDIQCHLRPKICKSQGL